MQVTKERGDEGQQEGMQREGMQWSMIQIKIDGTRSPLVWEREGSKGTDWEEQCGDVPLVLDTWLFSSCH